MRLLLLVSLLLLVVLKYSHDSCFTHYTTPTTPNSTYVYAAMYLQHQAPCCILLSLKVYMLSDHGSSFQFASSGVDVQDAVVMTVTMVAGVGSALQSSWSVCSSTKTAPLMVEAWM